MSTADYDVIAAEVHRKALQNLTDEMAITLVRTSGSPIVTESKDFSTCLMDLTPEHLGFSSYVLFHVGSSLIGTQVIAAIIASSVVPKESLYEAAFLTVGGVCLLGVVAAFAVPTTHRRDGPGMRSRRDVAPKAGATRP